MKKRFAILLGVVWVVLCAWAWFGPNKDVSDTERRQLAKFPEVSVQNVLSGKFMAEFETYSQDQFPLRDSFRKLKAAFSYYVLGQKDNNGIYLSDGYAVKLEYPTNPESIDYAASRFQYLYNTYLQDSRVFMAIVPDKAYYLADQVGAPSLDYDTFFASMAEKVPFAKQIDLTGSLNASSYYRTDIHWRQEEIVEAAKTICDALGIPAPGAYTKTEITVPFHGVYYGQAALPMPAETMYVLENEMLKNCTVTNFESNTQSAVYDMEKLSSKDLYDVFLSGSVSLLTIENPAAGNDKELIIFRDSFGSSMAPLLVQGYGKVTLVDIRYLSPQLLGRFLDFHGQDVLLLYSTPVLNNSNTLK